MFSLQIGFCVWDSETVLHLFLEALAAFWQDSSKGNWAQVGQRLPVSPGGLGEYYPFFCTLRSLCPHRDGLVKTLFRGCDSGRRSMGRTASAACPSLPPWLQLSLEPPLFFPLSLVHPPTLEGACSVDGSGWGRRLAGSGSSRLCTEPAVCVVGRGPSHPDRANARRE